MTVFRYIVLIAALAAPAWAAASPLDSVFAPRERPGIAYASLPVPVPAPPALVAPAAPEPVQVAPEPTLWERLKSLFD